MVFSRLAATVPQSWLSFLGFSHSPRKSPGIWLCCTAIAYCGLLGTVAKKATAAENIILSYGALELSVSVDALETYAQTGKLQGQLASYSGLLSPEQLEQFKIGLTTSADFSHLAIAQFLYSFQGEKILERVSKVVKTQERQPGFYAIRSALILAAADTNNGGLTPLNVLKKFPTKVLRVDSRQGIQIIKDLSRVVQTNDKAIAAVESEAALEAQMLAAVTPQVQNPTLLQAGKIPYRQENLTMKDRRRDRVFPVDLYVPKLKDKQPLPLIVISHGLGSDLTTFAYFAKHLASHGFAVAVPEHPGSSARQIEALLNGLDSNVTPPEELIDRPLDIKFLLDKLARDYSGQIDTDNVGMIGQSFGAYTTLALAGAELNWQTLEQDCLNLNDSWNVSLLLQCLALQLPLEDSNLDLRDRRIKAAVVINPLTSSVFGQANLSQIKIPLMMVSGSSDTITPALSEQILPFTWLTDNAKYLVLLEKGTHFSTLNESAGSIPVPEQAIGPSPKIAQDYMKQLGLAFFNTYIEQESEYAQYLNATYGSIISKEQFPLSLVEFLDPKSLELRSPKKP